MKKIPKIVCKDVWMAGQRYKVGISHPEPKGTAQDAARIIRDRYIPRERGAR